MTSRIAGEELFRSVGTASRRAEGRRRQILFFESSRFADQIGDIYELPVKPKAPRLQNDAGEFLFLVGYSEVGGTDVIE